ncbi:hypothetical protein Pan14r_52690 [Crateriforma conspicua]|uniref:Uncharacterized protein n=1 Tax=Crateriforma conspicua TaxID=2527996 RepID=A0A5C5XS80_9PLAN|nr:hypothetical protein Mal65_54900 [Crateriforma conspicua]TWT65720.1 hypothetical protein Pan14r_52690 [Crateriforma conspicua]
MSPQKMMRTGPNKYRRSGMNDRDTQPNQRRVAASIVAKIEQVPQRF